MIYQKQANYRFFYYLHVYIPFEYDIEEIKRSKIHDRRLIPTQMPKTTSALVNHYRSPVFAGMNVDPVETPIQFCKNLDCLALFLTRVACSLAVPE